MAMRSAIRLFDAALPIGNEVFRHVEIDGEDRLRHVLRWPLMLLICMLRRSFFLAACDIVLFLDRFK